jgi:hypothetical protein
MKHKLYWTVIALFFVIFGFSGCDSKTKTTAENRIQLDSLHIDKTYHLLENPNNPNCNLQITFVFPARYENKEVLAMTQRHFIRSFFGEPYENLAPEAAAEQYVEDYLNEYKSLESDFLAEAKKDEEHEEHEDHEGMSSSDSWFSYYEFSSNEILYNKNDLLCYSINYERYTGGAHGAHSCKACIIDLTTGLELKEKDFFTDGYQENLAQILVNKIAKENHAENAKDLENQGFFSIDEIYPNDNFAIDDTGITYYFNEYEIAAYVVGMTRVHLAYDEIRHLLRKDGRIALPAGN